MLSSLSWIVSEQVLMNGVKGTFIRSRAGEIWSASAVFLCNEDPGNEPVIPSLYLAVLL